MIEKQQIAHLLGLKFDHGTTDCYSILCQVYKDLLDITLTNYARPNDWWVHNEDLYLDNFKKEGFYVLDIDEPLRPFDVFLIALPDPRNRGRITPTNHCAVYLGGDNILHHRLGCLSETKMYRGAIKNFTTRVIRNKLVQYTPEEVTTIDLMDIILPHQRDRLLNAGTT